MFEKMLSSGTPVTMAPTLLQPPTPPDIHMEENQQMNQSFKAILLDKKDDLNRTYRETEGIEVMGMEELDDSILLTEEEKQRIYQPWRSSVIIKLMGNRVPHIYLKEKLIEL